jgi:hypothetical protein
LAGTATGVLPFVRNLTAAAARGLHQSHHTPHLNTGPAAVADAAARLVGSSSSSSIFSGGNYHAADACAPLSSILGRPALPLLSALLAGGLLCWRAYSAPALAVEMRSMPAEVDL